MRAGDSKGGHDAIRAEGIARFRARLRDVAGFAADRVDEAITDFDQAKLLTVAVNMAHMAAKSHCPCS